MGEHTTNDAGHEQTGRALSRHHFRVGWFALCVFVASGAGLDLLWAFKIGLYLDVGTELRRSLWTLAHAHGLGLSLLHLALAATLQLALVGPAERRLRLASRCLTWSTLLIPLGFFLGGLGVRGSDPGPGVALVPIGGLALLFACVTVARELRS